MNAEIFDQSSSKCFFSLTPSIRAIFLALSMTTTFISSRAAPNTVTADRPLVSRGFYEFAPIVSKVVVKKGEPFIEVFLEGEISEGLCFDKKEYLVEVKKDFTEVIARFRQNNPDAECKTKAKAFSDKVADLDPANPASRMVRVLGFYGWTQGELEGSTGNK